MSNATDYTENNYLEALLRGRAFPSPTAIYVALHTADPTDSGQDSEITVSTWPNYARLDAGAGEGIETGWAAVQNGVTSNAKQLITKTFDGQGELTITHFSLWDAPTGGNALVAAPLNAPRTLIPGDAFVANVGRLIIQAL